MSSPTGRVEFGRKSDQISDNMSGGMADHLSAEDAGARSGGPFCVGSGGQGIQSAKPEESRSVQDNNGSQRTIYSNNSTGSFGARSETAERRDGARVDADRDAPRNPYIRSNRSYFSGGTGAPCENRPRSDNPRSPPVADHQKKLEEAKKLCLEKVRNIGRELYEKCDTADAVVVTADGVEIPAHKMILAVRSPDLKKYFEELEAVPPPEKPCRISVDGDFSGEIVQTFIELLYTGESAGFDGPSAERDTHQLIFLLASRYRVIDLLDLAALKLTKNVNMDNFVDLLIMSFKENSDMMKGKVMEFAIKNRKAVLSSEGFKVDIKQNHLDLYLSVLEQLADV